MIPVGNGTSGSWNQAICERDWVEQRSTWDGDRLLSIEQPVKLTEPQLEQCAYCGRPTIWGVYVRADPSTVSYPQPQDDTP